MKDKELYIIIVLYKPTLQQLKQINALALIYNIILVDNTPTPECNENQKYISSHIYIQLKENKGIAFAQNVGIKEAQKQSCKYILFFDQDTIVDVNYPITILNEFKRIEKNNTKLVALGPIICDKDSGLTYKKYSNESQIDVNNIICPTLISSGTLSPMWAFDVVGYMDERLFIDYVDHEWCWRAKSKGFICCMNLKIKIQHKVGYKTIYCIGIPFLLASPFRYYYQYRNSYWLQRRKYVPIIWKIKINIRNIIGLFYIPFYSPKPFKVIICMLKGMMHGLFFKSQPVGSQKGAIN